MNNDNQKRVLESLTEKEKIVLESIVDNLYAEYGFTDIDIDDIEVNTELKPKIARGVIGSLVKKGVINVYEHDANFQKQEFYIITDDFLFLHPEWEAEKREITLDRLKQLKIEAGEAYSRGDIETEKLLIQEIKKCEDWLYGIKESEDYLETPDDAPSGATEAIPEQYLKTQAENYFDEVNKVRAEDYFDKVNEKKAQNFI